MAFAFISLPPEILLLILKYLPFPALASLQSTCKHIQDVMIANEDVIYRSAYSLHGFLSNVDLTTIDDLRAEHPQLLQGDNPGGWKDVFKKRFLLERSWAGYGPSSLKRHIATGERTCRLKVDEKHGFVINSVCEGGLLVTDIREPNRVLWSLDDEYMWAYSHVEYDNGFLAFSNRNRSFEIWRLATDFPESVPFPPTVDSLQISASNEASERHATLDGSIRGHFKPWALLDFTPDERPIASVRASRLVYPTFVAASCETAYLFDLPSSTLTGNIKHLGSTETDHRWISYVELSKRYVFICWSGELFVYRRPDVPDEKGEKFKGGERVYRLLPSSHFGPCSMRVDGLKPENEWEVREDAVVSRPGTLPVSQQHRLQFNNLFSAVHVNPDASIVIVALDDATCIVINDFLRVITGELSEYDTILTIEIGKRTSLLRYFAYDYDNGRFTVALMDSVYIFKQVWVEEPFLSTNDFRGTPTIRCNGLCLDNVLVSQVDFPSTSHLGGLNCIQLSETRLWVTWRPDSDDEMAAAEQPPVLLDMNDLTVFSVDFLGNRELDHPEEEYQTV